MKRKQGLEIDKAVKKGVHMQRDNLNYDDKKGSREGNRVIAVKSSFIAHIQTLI